MRNDKYQQQRTYTMDINESFGQIIKGRNSKIELASDHLDKTGKLMDPKQILKSIKEEVKRQLMNESLTNNKK